METRGLQDVSYFAIFDGSKDILYSLNYDSIGPALLLSSITAETDAISIYNDQVLFLSRRGGISLALLGCPGSNELFLEEAFASLVESLDKIVKRWSVDRISEKYDQVILVVNEFVFRGVVLTDRTSDLSSRAMRRSFENINGIKVTKGFASFINKATKSLRNN